MSEEISKEKLNIVGLVVNVTPNFQEQTIEKIAQVKGVEITGSEIGRLAVVIDEYDCDLPLVETITQINFIKGVISTTIAYHHFDGMNQSPNENFENQEKLI